MTQDTFIFTAPCGQEVCDFCYTSPTVRVYGCHNFLIPRTGVAVFQHESVGGWAACGICADFIDAGRWSELTERAVRRFIKMHRVDRGDELMVRQQFRDIHRLFRDHIIKEA